MMYLINYRITVAIVTIAICTVPLWCQEEDLPVRESVEEILLLSEDADPAAMVEELEGLKGTPVRINSGDEKELSRLFFLTEFQVMVLADHIRKNGSVVTLYELALLPAFDRNTVMLMAPYISLEAVPSKSVKSQGRTLVTMSASARFNTEENERAGMRSLLKVKHEQGGFSFGLTAENDPGEPFSFSNGQGVDFLSGYIEYKGKGFINRVIAGDFSFRAGEGLLFNSSQWMGSWLAAPSFMSGGSTAAPYTSTEENSFFRGISLTLGSMNAGAHLFVSSNRIDARVVFAEDSTATGVSNLVRGGVHTSESQLEARNSITENVAGMRLVAGAEKVRGGMTASVTHFSLPFIPDMTQPENLHAFEGDRLVNMAADIRAGTGSVLFFAEAGLGLTGSQEEASGAGPQDSDANIKGRDLSDSWAITAGLRCRPSSRVTFNILARHMAPGYYAFHSGAFRAGSGSGNESGIAASVHLEVARYLFVTAATDNYRIPWPRYRSSYPSSGSRIEIKGEYRPGNNLSLRLSWTSSSREYDSARETGPAVSETRSGQQLGIVFDFNPGEALRLTTRASASFISPSAEKGYLLCQDVTYAFGSAPLKLWFRYALCSTGGWDSRLYAWENDLHSFFSVPVLYGEMVRSYFMLSWRPSERIEVRLKYGFTDSSMDTGTGLSQEVKGQVRIAF
jgi:hypothetical protein